MKTVKKKNISTLGNPVRVLHVIGHMDRGGAETLLMGLYRNVDKNLIQFDFVENTDKPAFFDDEIRQMGGRIYSCPRYTPLNHITYVKWWNDFMSSHASEYTVIHGHLGSTAAIYLSIARKYGLYTIAHSHNTYSGHYSEIPYRLYSYPTRFIADYFFGCSKAAGVSRYGKRVANNKDKFSVLKNGINTSRFAYNTEKREEIRQKYNITGKYVIGHVGRFTPQKNHEFIIQVFSSYLKYNENAVLLLVGDGSLLSQIQNMVSSCNLTEKVIFAGVQNNVEDYYQAMDLFLFPSKFEGFGNVLLEAQCSGLPCVVSDVIPKEPMAVSDLIRVLSLSQPVNDWAGVIDDIHSVVRNDRSDFLNRSGYDIKDEAAKLQSFYLSRQMFSN